MLRSANYPHPSTTRQLCAKKTTIAGTRSNSQKKEQFSSRISPSFLSIRERYMIIDSISFVSSSIGVSRCFPTSSVPSSCLSLFSSHPECVICVYDTGGSGRRVRTDRQADHFGRRRRDGRGFRCRAVIHTQGIRRFIPSPAPHPSCRGKRPASHPRRLSFCHT